MFISVDDHYEDRDSRVHRLDPRTKLVVALALILTLSLLPFGRWIFYLTVWLMVMGVAILAQISPAPVLRRSLVALPFALAALTLPFTVPGEVIGHLPLLNWPVTQEGLTRAGSIVMKSWVSVQVGIVLVMVTSLPDLLWALRGLHVPEPLVAIVGFMYRYLFVMADEVSRLLRARASRSAARVGQHAGGTLFWRGRAAGFMVGSLMLRSFERSERIYNAMASRGYTGEIKTFSQHRFAAVDSWVLASALVVVILLVILGR
jgi:cobalt/nickel transport system permease protein